MKAEQKDRLRVIDKDVIRCKNILEEILAEEQAKFDKMGLGLQESSTGAEINIGIHKLKAMIEDLDGVIDMIGDLI